MIPDDAFDALCTGARKAIHQAWCSAKTLATPREPDHVYYMMRFGVPALVRYWQPVLEGRGIGLRVTGVFCHQTPYADFALPGASGNESCELGDLLIVHQHRLLPASGSRWVRRAVLLQAKMTDNGACHGRDPKQEYLYSNWPLFGLRGRGPRGAAFLLGKRDFRREIASGRYALIAREAHGHGSRPPVAKSPFSFGFPWWIADPTDAARNAGSEDAGLFIANMLYDTRQPRGRSAAPISGLPALQSSPNNHFDVTVEELLRITAARTVKVPGGSGRGHRGETGLVCFQRGSLPRSAGRSGFRFQATPRRLIPIRPPEEPRGEGDGISLILIETAGEAEER